MSNSALGLLPIYSEPNSKTCCLQLGWGLLGECCLYFCCLSVEQISWGMPALVLTPQKDAPCPEHLRAPCSETCFLICVTMSLVVSFRVWEKQNILLHNKYLHLFLEAEQSRTVRTDILFSVVITTFHIHT